MASTRRHQKPQLMERTMEGTRTRVGRGRDVRASSLSVPLSALPTGRSPTGRVRVFPAPRVPLASSLADDIAHTPDCRDEPLAQTIIDLRTQVSDVHVHVVRLPHELVAEGV